MSRFPILLDLENSSTLVAGKGHLAIAKIRLLLAAGARVTALTYDDPKIENEFKGKIEILHGAFRDEYLLDKKLLYISGVDSKELIRLVSAAKALNIPYNHVDDPENSNFTTPAMVHRGPLTVAISTNGKAPVLSRNLRAKIENFLPSDLGGLIEALHEYRPGVNKLIDRAADKLKFWNSIYSDREIGTLLKLKGSRRHNRILKLIGSFKGHKESGHVLIVGAGPGDPELLTIKAHRALQEADVIIYDNLVSDEVLNLSRRDAELIYVGKKRTDHFKTQNEINQIIVDHARKGLLVVRLKGGDPMIFGRVAEELDALNQENISHEIIPGITAAAGIAASTEIPLTHREHASMVTLSAGQLKGGTEQNFTGLAGTGRTVAVYMGIKTAKTLCATLVQDGFPPNTPIAIIENGTCKNERRIYGELSDLGDLVIRKKVQSPALLIVGDVVAEAPDYAVQTHIPFRIAN